MKKYMFLFRGGDSGRVDASPEEMQRHIAKWGAWFKGLGDKGQFVSEICRLYDALYRLQATPVIALNRAIAVGMAEGPERAVAVLEAVPERERLSDYPFYAAALGDAFARLGEPGKARPHFRAALCAARTNNEKRLFERKLKNIGVP